MRKSRLSEYKQSRLIEHFIAGSTARCAAKLVNVNRKTAIYYFLRLCKLIFKYDDRAEKLQGEIEVDESYFGGKRKGKRGRGAAGMACPRYLLPVVMIDFISNWSKTDETKKI